LGSKVLIVYNMQSRTTMECSPFGIHKWYLTFDHSSNTN
jgi:hypothetical protein